MVRSFAVPLAGACALLLPLLSPAHHSVAFYSTDTIELAGEITKAGWQSAALAEFAAALRERGRDD